LLLPLWADNTLPEPIQSDEIRADGAATVEPSRDFYDAIVLGGGFFGCCLALALSRKFKHVLVVEREQLLLSRASFVNQARVHNGYHYPRSLITALRSAVNYPRFLADLEDCLDRSFSQIYAIARSGSRVSAYQFQRFCQSVQIPVSPVAPSIAKLFNSERIEAAFATEECAFNSSLIRIRLTAALEEAGVEVRCGLEARRLSSNAADGPIQVEFASGTAASGASVFNCTYSQLNHLLRSSGQAPLPLKHEITEMAMIRPPEPLRRLGVTVMDGPFFSTMPFPALGLHSLSHVCYTPHEGWNDAECDRQPPRDVRRASRWKFMIKDAARYLPCMADAAYVTSLFETKTVLVRNEVDDGRPILCRPHYGWKNHFVILGAKIDNIYDVLKALGVEAHFPGIQHEYDAGIATDRVQFTA
jgi:glycine/D-amino acid oxidase-like deaminating enzyme